MKSKLSDFEEKFKLILENSNDLIAFLNQNFEHEFINENAYLNVLGYAKEDIIGKLPRGFIHPDDIIQTTQNIKKGYFSKEIGIFSNHKKPVDYLRYP